MGAAKAAPKPAQAKAAPAKSAGGDSGVYVKNLNFPGISHETIKQAFKQCGEVKDVVLRNRKYAILYFKDAAGATKARELNGKVVKGQKISVEAAKRRQEPARETYCTSVFVGNLPRMSHIQGRAALKKEFAKCGEIVKVRTYQSGYGFIYYKDNAAAKKAVTTMDQQTLAKPFPEKRVVSVRYSIRTKEADAKKEAVRKQRIAAKKAKRN